MLARVPIIEWKPCTRPWLLIEVWCCWWDVMFEIVAHYLFSHPFHIIPVLGCERIVFNQVFELFVSLKLCELQGLLQWNLLSFVLSFLTSTSEGNVPRCIPMNTGIASCLLCGLSKSQCFKWDTMGYLFKCLIFWSLFISFEIKSLNYSMWCSWCAHCHRFSLSVVW